MLPRSRNGGKLKGRSNGAEGKLKYLCNIFRERRSREIYEQVRAYVSQKYRSF